MKVGFLQGRRILVLEDDYYLASDAADWLQGAGAEVIGPTGSPEEACRLLDTGFVDLAVVDVNLGYGPDFDVARRLRSDGIPVLFATGYDGSVMPAELADQPRLEKPFGGPQLIAAIGALEARTLT